MKNIVLSILILFFVAPELYSQDRTEKRKAYKIWVKKMDGSKVNGYLYSTTEQGINISTSSSAEDLSLILIEAENIREIRLRRKGSVGRGLGIGFLGGALIGAIIGFADGDNDDKCSPFFGGQICTEGKKSGEKATELAVGLGIFGAGVGAVVGTGKKKFLIDGNTDTYISNLVVLKNYSLVIN